MTTQPIARELRQVAIEEEMRSSYLDYAMSVIVARALPDVRDGLKPVQRRILYAMAELGLRPNAPYKKSARIVGEVLGKYHPHGDAPVYDALVRMAQDFTMRYPLVDGQGNFGSVDDDPPAAMRYTEARLAPIALEMLADIDRDTVDFTPNFDATLNEPSVLPARLPNLLVNGAAGIAVGMATSIPPHNLGEVCDAICYLIDHYGEMDSPETLEALLGIVKGPDFPTGAVIMGREGIREAYTTGQGRIVVRARTQVVEPRRSGRPYILVTELPYQVNKAALVARIAQLVKERRLEGVTDVRDESGREGLRVVIELRRDAQPETVLNILYKHTPLQTAFNVNMLALVGGQPQVLDLRQALRLYLEFRQEVVTRRARHDLRKAREKAHLLEGLRIAIQFLDEVIAIIRGSPDAESARNALMARFSLDQGQAQAILDMQLRRLSALEREKLEQDYQQTLATIAELEALLADPQKVLAVVREETLRLKEHYADPRRTEVSLEEAREFTREEIEPHLEVVVTLSANGYIKRLPLTTYRLQHRGGKGVRGMTTKEDDALRHILLADTHDYLLFLTDRGRAYALRCYELPADSSRTGRGVPLANLLALRERERVTAVLALSSLRGNGHLVLVTQGGRIKRVRLSALASIRSSGLALMALPEGDSLASACLASPQDEVVVTTARGRAIVFPASQVPLRSRQAGGVRALRLRDGDRVVAVDVVDPQGHLLLLTANGFGKRTPLSYFRRQSRGGQGVTAFAVQAKTGPVVAAQVVRDAPEVVVVTARAQVARIPLEEIKVQQRHTRGVAVVDLNPGDQVASVACLRPRPSRRR